MVPGLFDWPDVTLFFTGDVVGSFWAICYDFLL